MKVGRKHLAQQQVIIYGQRHCLLEVHQVVEGVTRSIVHGKLWYEKSSRQLIVYYMRSKRCGEHVIQSPAY